MLWHAVVSSDSVYIMHGPDPLNLKNQSMPPSLCHVNVQLRSQVLERLKK
jgi:hypothetical protein